MTPLGISIAEPHVQKDLLALREAKAPKKAETNAVIKAVVGNPKLILADEPTGNLHSSQAKEIMELFKRLNDEGTTIIQVTHSEANAQYGNRIIKLRDGWIQND